MANHVKTVREHLQQGHEALEAALHQVEGQNYPHEGALRGAHYHLKAALSNFEHLPEEEFEEKPVEPKEEKPEYGAGSRSKGSH